MEDPIAGDPARPPQRTTLRGRLVAIEPLDVRTHGAALWEATRGEENEALWRYMSDGPFGDRATFDAQLERKAASADPLFFAIVDRAAGRAVGYAAYMRIEPQHRVNRRVAFRIYAPQAQAVKLAGSDIPGNGPGAAMTKGENGVWEVTLGPIQPGAYRYNFNVDGVATIDPRSSAISESNANIWSLVYVPGADFMDTKEVPHGAVAAVTYYSSSLKKFRRMHVYTPPGYETGQGKYPVFYLLHGAGDNDDAWTSVGRAGFILDN